MWSSVTADLAERLVPDGERDCWAKRYSEANRDAPAMATGRHRDHVPVSVELGSKCRRDQTDDCNSGQSEGAHTIANHGCPHSEVRAQVKPRRRGDTGASGSVWGGTCDGEGNPSPAYAATPPCAFSATQDDLTLLVPFCRRG
jgi:hypothetical protein